MERSESGLVEARCEADVEWIRELCLETCLREVDGAGVSAVIRSLISACRKQDARMV